jgi:hypothetical protein
MLMAGNGRQESAVTASSHRTLRDGAAKQWIPRVALSSPIPSDSIFCRRRCLLPQADAIVLLASFAAFVPPGPRRSRVRRPWLKDEIRARAMPKAFTARIAEPQSAKLLPTGPLNGPLDQINRSRLREDLDLLARCDGLPPGFPHHAYVLIFEAEGDRIVEREARRMLREALPEADVITSPGVGHALLADDVIDRVAEWAENSQPYSTARQVSGR